ncbi:hypothetical protein GOBAR_AA38692 [Gossypium barbadense]|uniref:Endonuclease/exonuclease/phosphatase domain-containing protein n=1 Tax=Gossypium barbadense TaxID=3634 RepID=A0A2P5VT52_GOSBA|nr:hypothetical protein GOBAR_AA38692 [Gossypium barbadense]
MLPGSACLSLVGIFRGLLGSVTFVALHGQGVFATLRVSAVAGHSRWYGLWCFLASSPLFDARGWGFNGWCCSMYGDWELQVLWLFLLLSSWWRISCVYLILLGKVLDENCRGLGNHAKLRELQQLLDANRPGLIFLSETKMSANNFRRVQYRCRLPNGLTVNSEGRSGGLALMWRDGMNVSIQNYSKHHIDSMRVGESVREEWIVGGDFNAFLNDGEKEGGRRGVRAQMNEFKEVMDELALVDIKPDSIESFPFIATKVVRQTQSDHDAIILDLWGRKPKECPKDNRLSFKFDVWWAGDVEAKDVIERAWNRDAIDIGEKIQRVRSALSPWQSKKYGKLKRDMQKLEKQINWIIDSTKKLKDAERKWVTNSKDISKVAKDYFVRLFRSNGQNANIQEMGYIQECITRETNE